MNRGRKLVDRSCPPRFVMSLKKLFKWRFRCRLCCSCTHSDLEQDISLESKPDTVPGSRRPTHRDSDGVLVHFTLRSEGPAVNSPVREGGVCCASISRG